MLQRNFDAAAFLRDDWQQRPRLIRQGLLNFRNPLEPDELAGLACEEGIDSRIVQRYDRQGAECWPLEHGPFPEARFGQLPARDWTLLVQAVNHGNDAVAALLEPFRFLPDWRIDDIMVSYAATGGSVGPHFDYYDVFLVQGLGRRRWQIGARCDDSSPLLPHPELRVLRDFEATDEWLLEPGDILYLPPGVSHWGIGASDDCMTYSIGFRAPSQADLIGDWCDDQLAQLGDDRRYRDPPGGIDANPGVIRPEVIAEVRRLLLERLDDPAALGAWFGSLATRSRYPAGDDDTLDGMQPGAWAGQALFRNPASRYACLPEPPRLLLFVDGECHPVAADDQRLALALCRDTHIAAATTRQWAASPGFAALVDSLLQRGKLLFYDDATSTD